MTTLILIYSRVQDVSCRSHGLTSEPWCGLSQEIPHIGSNMLHEQTLKWQESTLITAKNRQLCWVMRIRMPSTWIIYDRWAFWMSGQPDALMNFAQRERVCQIHRQISVLQETHICQNWTTWSCDDLLPHSMNVNCRCKQLCNRHWGCSMVISKINQVASIHYKTVSNIFPSSHNLEHT